MLSPQVPQWSRHSVARVRRRGDRPPPLQSSGVVCLSIRENMVRQGILSLSGEKWNGSRHLVFWSLGTLIGLRDWVRRLVA